MSIREMENNVVDARSELEATIAELKERLNVPKRAKKFAGRTVAKVRKNPVPWIVGTAGAIVATGVAIYFANRKS